MLHFTIDGFQGFRSRFDHVPLIQEVLEEVPTQLGLKPVMPAFMLPYYNGVVPEDCGVSAFVFLAGGHFTLHTFSFREAYFADRSEEHTSELQSHSDLVCRLLLEKKK